MQIVLEHRAGATEEEIGLKWGMSERNVRRIIRDFTESMPEPMREPLELVEIHLEQLRSVIEELAQAERSRTYARLGMIPNLGQPEVEEVDENEELNQSVLAMREFCSWMRREKGERAGEAVRAFADEWLVSLGDSLVENRTRPGTNLSKSGVDPEDSAGP